jgi:hypothetical protein
MQARLVTDIHSMDKPAFHRRVTVAMVVHWWATVATVTLAVMVVTQVSMETAAMVVTVS